MARTGLVVLAVTAALLVTVTTAAAPTDDRVTWQIWGYVDRYQDRSTGDVWVRFKDTAGQVISEWPDSRGQDVCQGAEMLVLAKERTDFDRMARTLLSAGLARKKVKIGYEWTGGACYLKMLAVQM